MMKLLVGSEQVDIIVISDPYTCIIHTTSQHLSGSRWTDSPSRPAEVNANLHVSRCYVINKTGQKTKLAAPEVSSTRRNPNEPELDPGFDYDVLMLGAFNFDLVAAGKFFTAGGTAATRIAGWDGFDWSPFGSEIDSTVHTLYVHNGTLIAGGSFGTVDSGRIAAWNGSAWVSVSRVVTDVIPDQPNQLPSGFAMEQNYPNPFNPSTTIEYTLTSRNQVSISVYNNAGPVSEDSPGTVSIGGNTHCQLGWH